ncbi:hypothetical protein [Actinoplanes couchii]|uniref:Integral membrane protein n=1 Tax=Actinoplanes couchii TaxID=403638 RepID=A0ABQ3XMQ0_9ACTN|nr:hypothetical protein [Actinoplanes couchii]MDR6317794.1 hypothetical protein [Actinoplanes couchii]GID59783.1 hypothetical protein Aco03nite_081870 [Actinoplanes couchii]
MPSPLDQLSGRPPVTGPPPSAAPGVPAEMTFVHGIFWLALTGGLLHVGSFLGLIVADGLQRGEPGETLALVALFAVLGSPLVLMSRAVSRAAAGRGGARAVLWSLGPAATTAVLALATAMLIGVSRVRRVQPLEIVAGVLSITGAVLYYAALTISATILLMPAAREFVSRHRDPGRSPRGRRTITVAVVLLGLATAINLSVAAYTAISPRAGDGEQLTSYLTLATILAGGTAIVQVVVFGCTLMARLAGSRAYRASAYVLGLITSLAMAPAAFCFAVLVDQAGREAGGAGGVFATVTITGAVVAALLHLVAVLLLAMPSVSAWLDHGGSDR